MRVTLGLAPLNEPLFHGLPLFCPVKWMVIRALVPLTPLMSTVSLPPGPRFSANSPSVIALG
jgi:hypothetical protein